MENLDYVQKTVAFENAKVLESIEWMEKTLSKFYGLQTLLTEESRNNAFANKRDAISLYLSWRNWEHDNENFAFVVRLIESYLKVWR